MLFEKYQLHKTEYYMKRFNISSLCAKVLETMQLEDFEIDEILNSNISLFDIDDSFTKDIVKRIYKAKMTNEKVLVCGDYDCDGICATTILYDALLKYGINVGYFIPNRFSQGYGLHVDTVDMAYHKGYTLLITVDNGVKATEALQKAKSYNMDIILSDHHNYEEQDLIYDYFLHPSILPTLYKDMCGAGIALLIAKSLIGLYEHHIILAGIATIGDVMPLRKINRILVKECITLLLQGKYPLIQALANDTSTWDEKKIAFQIVPKLNSAGRLADKANVNNIVKYLLHDQVHDYPIIIQQINALNTTRKQLSDQMETIATSKIKEDCNFHILYDKSFHEGLNGIIASRFVKKLQKPVMVLSENDNILKGSIRSFGIDLTNFFDDIKDELLTYGGHKEAAGISFYKDKLNYIENYVHVKSKNHILLSPIKVLYVNEEEISFSSLSSLDVLRPFGKDFECPLFMCDVKNINVTTLGNGNHLKYANEHCSYLYFNSKNRYSIDKDKTDFTFIGTYEISTFRNKKSITMIVDHIKE